MTANSLLEPQAPRISLFGAMLVALPAGLLWHASLGPDPLAGTGTRALAAPYAFAILAGLLAQWRFIADSDLSVLPYAMLSAILFFGAAGAMEILENPEIALARDFQAASALDQGMIAMLLGAASLGLSMLLADLGDKAQRLFLRP